MESLYAYIPVDRRLALINQTPLPERTWGAALFADISGFTRLTEALVQELGALRGAEELTHHLNRVYDALIAELDRFGGSVIGFSGDAITCWLDQDDGLRATACALAMQDAISRLEVVTPAKGVAITLAMKAAVATGEVSRLLVGDPHIQLIEVLAGATLDRLAAAEHLAAKGEILLTAEIAQRLEGQASILAWKADKESGARFAVVGGLLTTVEPHPWPPMPPQSLSLEAARPWLLTAVYERLSSGQGDYLAEFRPAVALFTLFGGIDYDQDPTAGQQLDNYIRRVQGVLRKYDGNLIQLTMGDKGSYLMASFGAPIAHEDDTLRAVSAALELREIAPSPTWQNRVQIGIAKGRMRAGSYGSRTRRTYGVLSDETNLAARLMQAALPGQILATQVVKVESGDTFEWDSLPPLQLKGKTRYVKTFSLAGTKRHSAIHLQEPQYAIPMVGRREELAHIHTRLQDVLAGRGRLIGIRGEAGLGKSRLLAEVIHLANQRHLFGYGGEAQSFGSMSSYHAWHSVWRGFFNLESTDPLEVQIQKLESQLGSIDTTLLSRLPLLGPVLNIPIPENDLTRSLDSKLRKASLETLLVDSLRHRAARGPVFIAMENGHWLDPLSQELLAVIGRGISDIPVLLVIAYRPQGAHEPVVASLSSSPHFSEVQLAPFTPTETEELIRLKLESWSSGEAQAPAGMVEHISQRSEGNPFYIEEILNFLHDRGFSGLDELPSSLHSLILTRIDQRTESQRLTLKLASVIGRMFIAAWLWGAFPELSDPKEVVADLEALNQVDLTTRDASDPELAYLFKHIVTQEVAYDSLPFTTRAILHDQVGQFIEVTFPNRLDQFLDLLAFHYSHSGNIAKKRSYLLKAGEAAQAKYANQAAIDYYQQLLPWLDNPERIPVMLKLGQVLEVIGEWSQAASLYQEAQSIAVASSDQSQQAHCLAAMGELLRKRGDYDGALLHLKQAQVLYEQVGDQTGLGQVLHYAGTVAAQKGEYPLAIDLYQQSLVIRRELNDGQGIAALLSNLGILARYQGDLEGARRLSQEALHIRQETGDRWGIAISLNNLGNQALDEKDFSSARAYLEQALAIQREVGDKYNLANALNNLGNVAREQGDFDASWDLYRQSLRLNAELGASWQLAYVLEDMGLMAVAARQPQRALRLIGAAAALRDAHGSPPAPNEQARLDQALEQARRALEPARAQSAWDEGRQMSLEAAIHYANQNQAE